MLDTVDLEL